MQEVRRLATKLFANGGSPFGNDIFSMEVRRWSPDAAARASVPTAPGADPTLMRMVQLAGLLGEEESVAERTTEYVTSGEGGTREREKREGGTGGTRETACSAWPRFGLACCCIHACPGMPCRAPAFNCP